MRYLGILTMTFVLAAPAVARKHHPARSAPHVVRQKEAPPPASEPTQPAPAARVEAAPAPVYATAQSDDDEVPGKKHKK